MQHNFLVVDVINCSRCGNNHKSIKFEKFKENAVHDSDGTAWEYWSMCPTLNEPLIMESTVREAGQPLPANFSVHPAKRS